MKWVQLCISLNICCHCPSLGLEWKLTFSSLVVTAEFPNFLAYWVPRFHSIIFEAWNSSAGIPSPPLFFFFFSECFFLRPTWLHTSGCLALGEWSHHCGYLGLKISFCIVLLCILATSSFFGSKITADGACSHEIKGHLLLGRKAMTNLDSIIKAEILLYQQRSI